jgi:membrane protein implicated in regulation of membrane protease activity
MPWHRVRSGLAFLLACFLSPCCAPLIVPLAIALLAGTPAALWLSANLGLIYGAMTALSIVSLVLAVRWWGGRRERRAARAAATVELPKEATA